MMVAVAAAAGQLVKLRRLLDNGGNADALVPVEDSNSEPAEDYRATALCLAAVQGHVEVAALLLDRKASPGRMSSRGQTPMMLAASHGHTAMVKLLIERGADLDTAEPSGEMMTAFHFACSQGHPDVVEALARAGCDMNAKTKAGYTGEQLSDRKAGYARATAQRPGRYICDARSKHAMRRNMLDAMPPAEHQLVADRLRLVEAELASAHAETPPTGALGGAESDAKPARTKKTRSLKPPIFLVQSKAAPADETPPAGLEPAAVALAAKAPSGGGAESDEALTALDHELTRMGLQRFAEALRELGCVEPADLQVYSCNPCAESLLQL